MTNPAKLIQRMKNGDVEATWELIEHHRDALDGYLRRRFKGHLASDIPDACQEVMMRALEKLPGADNLRLQTGEEFSAMLMTIAQREIANKHRRAGAKVRDIKRNEGDAAFAVLAATDTTASEAVRGDELRVRLEGQMTPSEVKIVDMRLKGYTFEEIAKTMDRSEGGISQKLERLRRRLKRESRVMAEVADHQAGRRRLRK